MNLPTISVLMPQYNHKKYLPESLGAILALKKYFHEIIICDDCSTDGSWEFLTDYIKIHPEIRLLRNERNLGVLKNMERLLSEATGDYVTIPAADDVWIPENMEKLILAMPSNPDCKLFCGLNSFLQQGKISLSLFGKGFICTGRHDPHSVASFYKSLPWGPSGVIIKHDSEFDALYHKFSLLEYHSDGFLALVFAEKYPFYFLNEPLAIFRETENNFSKSISKRSDQWRIQSHLFYFLKNYHPQLYTQMVKANLFDSYGGSSYLLFHPTEWDQYTFRIILHNNILLSWYYRFRYGFVPFFFSERVKRIYRRYRNRYFGKPRDFPKNLEENDSVLK